MTGLALRSPDDLTTEEQAELDAHLLALEPLTFREFVSRANPRFIWYDHCARLATVLQQVADDELFRVIVEEPPRHGKSEEICRLFAAYYIYRHPERWVGLNTYGAELAYTLSRSARDNYERAGGAVRPDAGAVKHWETPDGGGMWAAGVGGPIAGKGCHLGIIDDPVKNSEEAASQAVGHRNREWYRSTFYTRLEPNAALIVVHTRWPGPGDLIGWLFEEEGGEEPERWHVVHFEAEKEQDAPEIPSTCILEHDPREPGEALCPERYPVERLRSIAKRLGRFFYSALFQQRPRDREGKMFPRDKALVIEPNEVPGGLRWIRYWDKAATPGAGDYTAGVKMAVVPNGYVIVAHVVRGQFGSDERKRVMLETARMDGQAVEQWIEQEPGSSGKDSAQSDVRMLAGFSVYTESVTGDKVSRADPLAAQWQGGNVRYVRGEWNADYLDEMASFPDSLHDDQVDASSGAFNKLTLGYSTSHIGSQKWLTATINP